jgi:hypothetical protein
MNNPTAPVRLTLQKINPPILRQKLQIIINIVTCDTYAIILRQDGVIGQPFISIDPSMPLE